MTAVPVAPILAAARLLLCILAVAAIPGQTSSAVDYATDTIDASTRWTIHTQTDVTVSSPAVRLSDVATLIGQHSAWDRIAKTPIAMIPADSMTIRIDRNRLAAVIERFEAIPATIDYTGPQTITVRRTETAPPHASSPTAKPATAPVQSAVVPASYRASYQSPPTVSIGSKGSTRRFDAALKRFAIDWIDRFAIEPSRGLPPELSHAPINDLTVQRTGPDRAIVTLRTGRRDNLQNFAVPVQLRPHPTVVVPTGSIARGTLLSRHHFKLAPLPAADIGPDMLTNIDSLVGKQSTAAMRSGRPVTASMVSEPMVVRRGELLQLRVVGGGVSVTTAAKSMSDAAGGELIEVETLSPRKRLIARVIDSSTAEIVTRSPVVR